MPREMDDPSERGKVQRTAEDGYLECRCGPLYGMHLLEQRYEIDNIQPRLEISWSRSSVLHH